MDSRKRNSVQGRRTRTAPRVPQGRFKQLVDQIQQNQVTSLFIRREELNEFGGFVYLGRLLLRNSSVTHLHFGDLLNLGPRDIELIAVLVQYNRHILQIDLSYNYLGYRRTKLISDALLHNYTLQVLDLSHNNIHPSGAERISAIIKENSVLKRINLSTNNIRDKGAKFVSEAIKSNSTLHEIDLSCNEIGSQGAKNIAESLKMNSTLQKIRLAYNEIGLKGAKSLASAIKMNSALHTMSISDNCFGPEGIHCIAEAIKTNSILENIGIEYYDIEGDNEEDLYEIEKVFAMNGLRKVKNCRKMICAFTQLQKDLIRLPSDKMILIFCFYPIMGILPSDEKSDSNTWTSIPHLRDFCNFMQIKELMKIQGV
jgi:hypothetical protein